MGSSSCPKYIPFSGWPSITARDTIICVVRLLVVNILLDSVVPYDDIIRRLPKALLLLFIYLLYGIWNIPLIYVSAEYFARYIDIILYSSGKF